MSRRQQGVCVVDEHVHGSAFRSFGAGVGRGVDLDPHINVDVFHMSAPTFRPHPHAGFSAVTYLFPQSPGAFVNRNSGGSHCIISPGALHWTQTARAPGQLVRVLAGRFGNVESPLQELLTPVRHLDFGATFTLVGKPREHLWAIGVDGVTNDGSGVRLETQSLITRTGRPGCRCRAPRPAVASSWAAACPSATRSCGRARSRCIRAIVSRTSERDF